MRQEGPSVTAAIGSKIHQEDRTEWRGRPASGDARRDARRGQTLKNMGAVSERQSQHVRRVVRDQLLAVTTGMKLTAGIQQHWHCRQRARGGDGAGASMHAHMRPGVGDWRVICAPPWQSAWQRCATGRV